MEPPGLCIGAAAKTKAPSRRSIIAASPRYGFASKLATEKAHENQLAGDVIRLRIME
jgi:hypothetical protein